MSVDLIMEKSSYSLAEEFKHVYDDKDILSRVKGYSKFQKRKINIKTVKRVYRLKVKYGVKMARYL